MKKLILYFFGFVLLLQILQRPFKKEETDEQKNIREANERVETYMEEQKIKEIQNCVRLGVQYFKALGSYPLLTNGKDANEEARRKCEINPKVFSGFTKE